MVKALEPMDCSLDPTSPSGGQTQTAKSLRPFHKPWFLHLEEPLVDDYERWVVPGKSEQGDLLIFLEGGVIPFVMRHVEELGDSRVLHFVGPAVSQQDLRKLSDSSYNLSFGNRRPENFPVTTVMERLYLDLIEQFSLL